MIWFYDLYEIFYRTWFFFNEKYLKTSLTKVQILGILYDFLCSIFLELTTLFWWRGGGINEAEVEIVCSCFMRNKSDICPMKRSSRHRAADARTKDICLVVSLLYFLLFNEAKAHSCHKMKPNFVVAYSSVEVSLILRCIVIRMTSSVQYSRSWITRDEILVSP